MRKHGGRIVNKTNPSVTLRWQLPLHKGAFSPSNNNLFLSNVNFIFTNNVLIDIIELIIKFGGSYHVYLQEQS